MKNVFSAIIAFGFSTVCFSSDMSINAELDRDCDYPPIGYKYRVEFPGLESGFGLIYRMSSVCKHVQMTSTSDTWEKFKYNSNSGLIYHGNKANPKLVMVNSVANCNSTEELEIAKCKAIVKRAVDFISDHMKSIEPSQNNYQEIFQDLNTLGNDFKNIPRR